MKMDTLPLYLACGNNHDGVTLIVCISNLFLFCFIDHKLYEFLWFLTIKLYAQKIKDKREQMEKHVMNLVMIQWKSYVSNTKQGWKFTI
jgi:hypothetical protein